MEPEVYPIYGFAYNHIVCYTCITGNYDRLHEIVSPSSNVDYICFSDQQIASRTWNIRQIPSELDYLSNVKKQRIVKICPHRYLSEYDISVWIDGNICIIGDINQFISQYDLDTNSLYTRVHPSRNCIYDEGKAIVSYRKDTKENIDKILNRYRSEGYPEHIGMFETCVILRKHNDAICKLLCNEWASELLLNSHRDQMSFNYVCWKNKFVAGILHNEFNMKTNNFFRLQHHG